METAPAGNDVYREEAGINSHPLSYPNQEIVVFHTNLHLWDSPQRNHSPLTESTTLTSLLEKGLSPEEFKLAFRHHPAGVAVITADSGDGPVGLTASSVFSVSADPAVLVFSLSADASAAPTILKADTVVVHMLLADQLDLAKLCATSGVDRFADTSMWDRLPTGEPYFKNVQARIRGRIINKMPIGNSTVVAVHALEAYIPDEEPASNPLVYHNRSWHHLGDHSKL